MRGSVDDRPRRIDREHRASGHQVRSRLSAGQQQWVITGYLISFGGLLMAVSRAGDYLGHRTIFLAGIAVFTMSSLVGGLAQVGGVLLAARFAQGAGAAALAPGSLTLLTDSFGGEQRARAISIWSAVSSAAGALGLVLGGLITSGIGWRWVLLVNVPIGVGLWLASWRTLPNGSRGAARRIDLPGVILVTSITGLLAYALSQAVDQGWNSSRVLVPIALAATAGGGFVRTQLHAPDPLLPPRVLRNANLLIANIIIVLLGAVLTATMYFLSLYEQNVLLYSPLTTGLSLLPMSAILTAGALASKNLMVRFGARLLITIGGVVMAFGLAAFIAISAHSTYTVHILVPSLVWAAGASVIAMPCVSVATSNVSTAYGGLASGLVNTARGIGGALGIALLATITASAESLVGGYRIALASAAGLAIVIAALGARLRD